MESTYQGISDIFFNACGSYLDATACKQCAPSIFSGPSMDIHEYSESREDFLQERDMTGHGSSRHPFDRQDDTISLSGLLLPHLPPSTSSSARHLRSRNVRRDVEDHEGGIFRLKASMPDVIARERNGICELNRCKAWSQDSDRCSLDENSIHSDRTETKLKLIHWDETVGDSNDLSKLFF